MKWDIIFLLQMHVCVYLIQNKSTTNEGIEMRSIFVSTLLTMEAVR